MFWKSKKIKNIKKIINNNLCFSEMHDLKFNSKVLNDLKIWIYAFELNFKLFGCNLNLVKNHFSNFWNSRMLLNWFLNECICSARLYKNLRNLGTLFAFPGMIVPRASSHPDVTEVIATGKKGTRLKVT